MNDIIITLKLYSGIANELKISDYDQDRGVVLNVKKGTSLRSILKKTGMKKFSRYIFFSGGRHVSVWKRFYEGAEVSCLRVSGGG